MTRGIMLSPFHRIIMKVKVYANADKLSLLTMEIAEYSSEIGFYETCVTSETCSLDCAYRNSIHSTVEPRLTDTPHA